MSYDLVIERSHCVCVCVCVLCIQEPGTPFSAILNVIECLRVWPDVDWHKYQKMHIAVVNSFDRSHVGSVTGGWGGGGSLLREACNEVNAWFEGAAAWPHAVVHRDNKPNRETWDTQSRTEDQSIHDDDDDDKPSVTEEMIQPPLICQNYLV